MARTHAPVTVNEVGDLRARWVEQHDGVAIRSDGNLHVDPTPRRCHSNAVGGVLEVMGVGPTR